MSNTPSGARLTLGEPRGPGEGGGGGGVAVALRLTTTSGSAERFSSPSRACCSSELLFGKRKKEISPVCGPRWVWARDGGTREQNAGSGVEGRASGADETRREALGQRNPNKNRTLLPGRCERAATTAAVGSGIGSKDHI
ncbi:Hypothetical predicted protein [Marmota monax]|uniref:Uncharacterized protein n=1 Tax=Marmota monax TaxID=9995 RepID=A0A5E4CYN2_MARMO|nr:hypothetical protein GHT09_017457 [Marmota monax]VTJ86915.1 Hypothetical predicted protein [Marmota monax]